MVVTPSQIHAVARRQPRHHTQALAYLAWHLQALYPCRSGPSIACRGQHSSAVTMPKTRADLRGLPAASVHMGGWDTFLYAPYHHPQQRREDCRAVQWSAVKHERDTAVQTCGKVPME